MSSGQRPLLNFQQGRAPCAQPARGRLRASLGVTLGYAGVIAPDVDTEDTVQLAAICAAVPASPVAKAGRANGGRVVACPPPPQPSPRGEREPPSLPDPARHRLRKQRKEEKERAKAEAD